MKAYSKDLRLKVLDALDRGMDRKEVARIFGVSLPSVKRWLKMRRESGDVEARPIPGPPARKGAMLAEWLPSQTRRRGVCGGGWPPVWTQGSWCSSTRAALRSR